MKTTDSLTFSQEKCRFAAASVQSNYAIDTFPQQSGAEIWEKTPKTQKKMKTLGTWTQSLRASLRSKLFSTSPNALLTDSSLVTCHSSLLHNPMKTKTLGTWTQSLRALTPARERSLLRAPASRISHRVTRIALAAFACSLMLSSVAWAQVDVTATGGVANMSYTQLNLAFTAINNGVHTGTITIGISGNTAETVGAVLNASGSGAASYTTITINPTGGANRSISGAIAGPLIDLNGADNVTIDGLNTGGNALSIVNTTVGGTPSTIRFINDASNNTVQNCTIAGATSVVTLGTIFFSTGTTTGNVNNTIQNNTITNATGGNPANAILSVGTSPTIFNSGTITNNNIQDYFSATVVSTGINLNTNNSAWTVTNNKLFQTTTRVFTTSNTHNGINVVSGAGYTITGNTIGFAAANGTGTTNLVGNSVALTGTFPTSYTTTGTATATRYIAINCSFTAGGTASSIQNNTIAGIALYTSSGASTGNGILCGININSGNANVGTTTGNTIGSAAGGGGASPAALYAANTAGGGTVVGIFATSTNTVTIQNNTMGSVDSVGTTNTLSGAFTGIDSAGTGGIFNISSNTIGNSTANNIRTGYTLSGANLSNSGTITSTTGTTSPIVGIRHAATGATVTINSNTLQGWQNGTTAGGALTGITSTGAVTTSATINSNLIGTASQGWINYPFANTNSTPALALNLSGAGTATTHSIQSNDFRGITFTTSGVMPFQFITISGATAANDVTTIANNTFTNLNINETTGNITFISHNYTVAATGTQTINNNSIVTGFNKSAAGGTVTVTTTNGSSVNGSICNITNNNFSNITVTGATSIIGINNTDGLSSGTTAKTITGNTFNNWTGGTSSILGINVSYFHTGNSTISTNTLTNISTQNAVTGISINALANSATSLTIGSNTLTGWNSTGSGGALVGITCSNTSPTININNNTIGNFASTGASTSTGLSVTGATTTNVFRNKIYDISGSSVSTSINGILVSSGTTVNVYNNLVGDLRAPTQGGNPNALIGLNITGGTAVNAYYNSVYLNSANTGVTFGSSAASVSTTPTVTLRNNIFVNTSTANGAAFTVAYRRSTTTLTSYGSTSNNNDFYAGTPSATNLIFYDGTNSDQTLSAYKTRVASRDSASVTENPPFLSTTGTNANFLHINTTSATQLESGGIPVSGITADFDGDTRNATTPDVGADEFAGIAADFTAPSISYTTLTNTASTSNRAFTGVTITDASGVNTTAGTKPRCYYKRSTDNNTFVDNTSGTNGWKFVEANGTTSPFDFTIDYSLLNGGSGVTGGQTVQYFIVAQDLAATPNVGINSGTFTAQPSSVALTSAAFPIGGTINSYNILATISGTFTVGTGGNYASLTAAVADLNSKVINGPVVFNLIENSTTPLDGVDAVETYPITINANSGSSAANTVTIKPASGQTISINPVGGSSTSIFKLNGCSYVTIDGSNNGSTSRDLTITNASTTGPNAVVWVASLGTGTGATNNTVKNCNIVGGNSTGTATFGVFVGGSSITTSGTGADNDNTTIQNNNITVATVGIYAFGTASVSTGGLDSLAITGNSVDYNGTLASIGIQVGNALNSSVSQNAVTEQTSGSQAPTGISLETGFVSSSVTRNNVSKALTTNTGGYGGRGITVGTGTATSNLTIANNFVSGVNGSNWNAFGNSSSMGIAIGTINSNSTITTTAGGINLYYNSVSMTGSMGSGSTTAITTALYVGTGASALDVRDNALSNTQTGTSTTQKNYAIYSAAANTAFTSIDYNDYFVSNSFNTASAVPGFIGSDRTNLAGIQAGFGGNTNSKIVDPLFTSSSDLHLQAASTLIDMGSSVGGIVIDIDGQTRPAGSAADIGADEVPPSPGTLQFSSATYSVTEAGMTATITVTRTGGTSGAASVMYNTSDGSATGGVACGGTTDYITTSGTLNWANGDAASKTFTVTVCNDGVSESSETVNLALSNVTGATLGTPNTATLTILNSDSFNGTYTVGAGGSYPSLTGSNGIIAALTNGQVTGPVVINLIENANAPEAVETYPITIPLFNGVSATNTVTIKPSAPNTTITAPATATSVFSLNGAKFTIIDGSSNGTSSRDLSIINSNSTTSGTTVISIFSNGVGAGSTNNTVKNCIIQNGTNFNSSTTSFNFGIYVGGNGVAAGPDNDSTTIQNNLIQRCQIGMQIIGANPGLLDNLVISGNTIGGTAAADFVGLIGMQVGQATGAIISGNTVRNIQYTAANDGAGILVSTGVVSSSVTQNVVNNLDATNTGGYGMTGIYITTATASSNVTVANNFVYDIKGTSYLSSILGDTVAGIRVAGTNTGGIKIYDNSVNLFGSYAGFNGASVTAAFMVNATTPTALDVRGNIFVNTFDNNTVTTDKNYAIYTSSANTMFTDINYNDYFVSGAQGVLGAINSTDVTTLAALQGATTKDANSKNVTPLFTSNTNLHLQATSTLLGMGVSIGGITTDIDGDTRPATPDIGADEILTPGTLQFSQASYGVNENGVNATLTVTRTGGSDGAVSASYNTADDTAVAPGDYTNTTGSVSWADGDSANKTITVPLADDMVYENTEDFMVALSSPTGGATLGSPNPASVVITDNDNAPTVQFDMANYSVNENAGTVTVTVTKSGATSLSATVHYATSDGSATSPADYAATSGDLTFLPNETSKTFMVTINDDTTFEGNETFNVTLSSPTNATLGTQSSSTVTIIDDDGAPLVQFSSATYTVGESDGTVTITVTKTGNVSALPATVNYATSDGTAISPADYTASSGTVTFLPNQTSQTFTVPISPDSVYEGNEDFTVTLSMPVGATLGAPSTATVTITDDDAAPSFSISDVTHAEGNAGTTMFTFTVTKSGSTAVSSSVHFATVDGTATVGDNDYQGTSGDLNFGATDTTMPVTVLVNGDTIYEPTETFMVHLSAPSNATISDADGTGTITNDDSAPTFTINNVTQAEGNAGQSAFVFTVTKNGATANNSSIDFATQDGTATSGSDYVANSGTLHFLPNETTMQVTVQVNGDTTPEPNETFFVNLSNPMVDGHAIGGPSVATGTGTITNDDGGPATVYVDDDWASVPCGQDPDGAGPATSMCFDAFATVEDGVNGVGTFGAVAGVKAPATGSTVIVYAGNYVLASNPNINNSMTIQGPNIGITPRNGGGSRVAEAVVNGNAGTINGSSGKTFVITSPATAVTISGFKFTNFDGNVIAEAGGAALTNVDLHQNIFDTNNGGLMYKFNLATATAVSFTDNKVANQTMTGINTALLFMGKLTNSHFDDNEVSSIASREFINLYDTITNSTISNNSLSSTAGLALLAANQSGVTFDNNTITSTNTAAGVGAICVSSNDGRTISNLAITNNHITTVTGGGIGVRVSTDTATAASINGVTITGNTISGTSAYGLDLDTFANTGTGTITNVDVINNTFVDNAFGPMLVYARPTSGNNVVSNLTLANNTFTEHAAIFGASFVQIDLRNVSGTNFINGNTYTLSGVLPPATTSLQAIGIRGSKTGSFGITNNDLNGGGVLHNGAATVFQSGIRIFSNDASTGALPNTAAIDAHNNFIRNWEDGVVVRDGVAGVYGGLPAGISVKFNNDDLSANSLKTIRSSGTGELIDASVTWWGTNTPSGVQGTTTAGVDFTPYLNSGTDTSGSAGFQGDLSVLHVTTLGAQVGATGGVQEGINDVTSGGTLNVHAGAYTGGADATANSVILAAGASPGQVTITGNVALDNNDTVPIEINGTNAATDYDNFIVNGTVTLGGATLSLSGTHSPVPGQVFRIIDNDSTDPVNGTFAGLPEGATIPNFLGSVYDAKITYVGGSGNDVEIVVQALPSFSIGDVTQAETNSGQTMFIFTVTKSGSASFSSSVDFMTQDNSAIAPGDYTSTNGTLNFGPTDTMQTITVLVNGDTTYETNETFFVNLSNAVSATISDNQGLGTITNDDNAPSFSIDDVTMAEGDSGTTMFTFTVTKTGATEVNANVMFATMDGTATTADNDYQMITGGLSFLPNETTKPVTVLVNGDTNVEPDETFTLHLSNPTNASISDADGTGTIQTDDGSPSFSINDVTMSEGNAGQTAFVFTVTKTGSNGAASTVNFQTQDGTATVAGNDYAANNGTLNFGPSDTTMQVTVQVNGDTTPEPDETFTVNIAAGSNATIGDGTGLGTITNDDGPPTTVYVDDNWASVPCGQDPDGAGPATSMCFDAFATIQGGINGVGVTAAAPRGGDQPTAGGNVIVYAGTYPESILVNKNVKIDGAGSGNNPAVDTIIDGSVAGHATFYDSAINITGSGASMADRLIIQDVRIVGTQYTSINIGGSASDNASVAHLTLMNIVADGTAAEGVGTYAKGIFVHGSGSMSDIVVDHYDGSHFFNGAIAFNDAGSFAAVDGFMLTNSNLHDSRLGLHNYADASSTTNENNFKNVTITDNTLSENTWKGMYFEALTNATIERNQFTHCGFGTVNGGNGNTAVELNLKYGNHHDVAINNNVFDNSGIYTGTGTDVSGALAIKPRNVGSYASNPATLNNVSVSENKFQNMPATNGKAIQIGEVGTVLPTNMTISFNALSDGTFRGIRNTTASGTVVAENNWWGTNLQTTIAGLVSGAVDYDPWIVLQVSASPNPINPGGMTTVTADMTHNSDNVVPSMSMFIPDLAVAWSATQGTMNPTSGTVTNGQAMSQFTSTSNQDGTATATVNSQMVTTVIDVNSPSYSINDVSMNEGNSGQTMFTFTVTKTGSTPFVSTVDYMTQDGTATIADNDYVAASGTLTFQPSDTTMQVTVLVNGDTILENDETFSVVLGNPTANGQVVDIPTGSPGVGTILNDDTTGPSFSINDVTMNEGNSGTTMFTFTVTKTGATGVNANVMFATMDGTATLADNDYQMITGSLSFLPNETMKQITVLVNGDTTFEPNETFTVELSNPVNATISDGSGLGTITNDDARPAPTTVYVNDDWTSVPNGTDPDGGGPATEMGYDAFATIQGGINGVANPGTVIVYAGNYFENPTVNKALNIMGPNAGAPGNGARVAEAIVRTVGNQNAVFSVSSNNVAINGFMLDGDDPSTTGVMLGSGEDTNTSYGVRPTGNNHVVVRDNIIKRVAIGFRGDGASQNNLITENLFDSIGFFDFGYAVSLRSNYYADVTNNKMTRVWTGVHTNNFSTAGGPAAWLIFSNEIHSYAAGILYWLQFNSATSASIVGNQISAETGAVANNFGMLFVTIQSGINPLIQSNMISGTDFGVGLTNTSTPAVITLDSSNTITRTNLAGVYLTDNLTFNPVGTTDLTSNAYTGPTNNIAVNINGVPITVTSGRGVAVENSRTSAADVQSTANVNGCPITVFIGPNAREGQAGASSPDSVQGPVNNIGVDVSGPLAIAKVARSLITGFDIAANVDGATAPTDPVTLTLTNSTISGNTAAANGDAVTAVGNAGGNTSVTITNSTLTDNGPGEFSIYLEDASLKTGNSIFNAGAGGMNIIAVASSTVTSLGYNLSSDNFGGYLTSTGDQINADPMLGPLKNNGGPTLTHAPLENSPAIDQGKDIGPVAPGYTATGEDQRGSTRPVNDPDIANAVGGDGSDIGAVELAVGVHPSSADSRKTHGAAGDFDVDLPLSGPVGIECRSGGATNVYKMIVNFETPVTFSGAAVTSGTGMVDSTNIESVARIDGGSGTQVTINLSGVTDVQTITVALFDVDDGTHMGDVGVRMRVMIGDATGNGAVNSSDISSIKAKIGRPIDGTTFRADVTANGDINSGDVGLTKSKIH